MNQPPFYRTEDDPDGGPFSNRKVLSEFAGWKEAGITENISQNTKENRSILVLQKELEKYDRMGVRLYMHGRRRSPRSIARACMIAEGGGYMRDYTEDTHGRITRVDFDYIRQT